MYAIELTTKGSIHGPIIGHVFFQKSWKTFNGVISASLRLLNNPSLAEDANFYVSIIMINKQGERIRSFILHTERYKQGGNEILITTKDAAGYSPVNPSYIWVRITNDTKRGFVTNIVSAKKLEEMRIKKRRREIRMSKLIRAERIAEIKQRLKRDIQSLKDDAFIEMQRYL